MKVPFSKRVTSAATIFSIALGLAGAATMMSINTAHASSHREAPFITSAPKVDGSDFYMFRSYETGREGYITLVANYLPLQDAYGGPNYFDLETNALYQIHIDNNGDAIEDITFSFNFESQLKDLQLNIAGTDVSVPLKNIGIIGPGVADTGALNGTQSYNLDVIYGDRRTGSSMPVVDQATGSNTFVKPADYIGSKSIPGYSGYAATHIYDVSIPNCSGSGKVFVGQRQESFSVNLGEVFDLVNLNPLGAVDGETNILADKNVTSLVLEVPIDCVTAGDEDVIGGWTTASLRQAQVLNPFPNFDDGDAPSVVGGAWAQVSRLGMPLVNEVIIGLKDKDRFNASEPKDDTQFANYVTNPTFPALLEILFPGTAVAPNLYPRTDLVAAFLTGLDGLNQPASIVGSEMLRLNTGIDPTTVTSQNKLGVLGGDLAGFPNGRRPGDDVVDAVLRVAMGALITDSTIAPNNTAPLTDGADISAQDFGDSFPYLNAPLPGAGN